MARRFGPGAMSTMDARVNALVLSRGGPDIAKGACVVEESLDAAAIPGGRGGRARLCLLELAWDFGCRREGRKRRLKGPGLSA